MKKIILVGTTIVYLILCFKLENCKSEQELEIFQLTFLCNFQLSNIFKIELIDNIIYINVLLLRNIGFLFVLFAIRQTCLALLLIRTLVDVGVTITIILYIRGEFCIGGIPLHITDILKIAVRIPIHRRSQIHFSLIVIIILISIYFFIFFLILYIFSSQKKKIVNTFHPTINLSSTRNFFVKFDKADVKSLLNRCDFLNDF